MKLYYAPGACSLSPHIVLTEAGLDFDTEKVDLRSKQTETGRDFRSINPKGYVPALELDDGQILTEGPAIVQYIADRKPDSSLAPPWGSMERYRLQEWLNFVATEIHKTFGPMFAPSLTEERRREVTDRLETRFRYVEEYLADRDYLVGNSFTVADAYLFTMLSWAVDMQLEPAGWPALARYRNRIAERPAVNATLKDEGLM
ncbi:MAG TPA: glutathione transferase GstA [Gammaproteobacteria bacterium]|nr:glutathione transferase GstA [Gammaproteobacteria bacterium]